MVSNLQPTILQKNCHVVLQQVSSEYPAIMH